jgi:hypothetical protein
MSEMFVFGLPLPPVDPSATIGDFSRSTINEVSGAFSQAQIEEFARDAVANALVAGANITVAVNDAGNTITISSTGGSGGGFTQAEIEEFTRDAIAAALVAGSNITITPNDNTNTITIAAAGGSGSGLTLEEVQDAVAAMIQPGSNMTVAYNDAAGTLTISSTGGSSGGSSSTEAHSWYGPLLPRNDQLQVAATAYTIFALYDFTFDELIAALEIANNSADVTVTVARNGTNIGTVTIPNNQRFASTTTISNRNIVKGDALTLSYTGGGVGTSARGLQAGILGTRNFAPSVPATPAQPNTPTAARTPGQITVTFTPVANTTSHRIDYSTDNGATWVPGNVVTSGTTTTFNSLVLGTAYVFSVIAFNGAAASFRSNASSPAVTFANVPSAPTISSSAAGNGQVSLIIQASADSNGSTITGYKILGRTPAGSGSYLPTNITASAAGAVTVTTLSGSPLANGTEYQFVAVATNGVGDSANSAPVPLTPSAGGSIPGTPGAPFTENPNDGAATFSWTAALGQVDSYNLRYRYTLGLLADGVTESWTTITGILPSQISAYAFSDPDILVASHNFQVQAVNNSGTSPWSGVNSFVFPRTSPLATPNVTAVAGAGNGTVALSWGAIAGAAEYVIFHSLSPSGPWRQLAVQAGTSYTHTGATNDVANRYRVHARSTNNASVNGTVIATPTSSAATPPSAPTNFTVTPGNSANALSWGPPSSTGTVNGGAAATITTYQIESSPNGTGSWTAVTNQSGTTFNHSPLANGVAVFYRVSAVNSAGLAGPVTPTPPATVSGTPQASAAPGTPTITSASGFDMVLTAEAFTFGAGGTPTSIEMQYATNGAPTTYSNTLTVSAPANDITPPVSFSASSGNIALFAGSQYRVRIRGVNASGPGPWSANSPAFTYTES